MSSQLKPCRRNVGLYGSVSHTNLMLKSSGGSNGRGDTREVYPLLVQFHAVLGKTGRNNNWHPFPHLGNPGSATEKHIEVTSDVLIRQCFSVTWRAASSGKEGIWNGVELLDDHKVDILLGPVSSTSELF